MNRLMLFQLCEVYYNNGVQQSTKGTTWWNTGYLQLSAQFSQCTSATEYSRAGGSLVFHYYVQ